MPHKLTQKFNRLEPWYQEEEVCMTLRGHGSVPVSGWELSLAEAITLLVDRINEGGQVANLTARVDALERKLSAISCDSLIAPILELPGPFELVKEIKVVVRSSEDEFVATFFDANVNASGCTEADAVSNLKEMLVTRFDYLDKMPLEKLGPAMVKQITSLRGFIRRRV